MTNEKNTDMNLYQQTIELEDSLPTKEQARKIALKRMNGSKLEMRITNMLRAKPENMSSLNHKFILEQAKTQIKEAV